LRDPGTGSGRVIAACATPIPIPKIPAHVVVVRDGQRLHHPPPSLDLQAGDEIRVGSLAVLTFSYAGNRYRIRHATLTLKCTEVRIGPKASSPAVSVLAVDLTSGGVNVRSASHPRRALVLSREMLAFATVPKTSFVVERNPSTGLTEAWTRNRPIITASANDPSLRINTRATYTALSSPEGIRLNVWPFDLSPLQRPTTPADGLPAYWADGLSCSVGCAPPGLVPGWPLEPFHQQHAIRAGINELRPAGLHVAVDIEANDLQPVYAIYSGRAYPRPTGSYGDY
jgi:hypothetical protein